MSGFDSHCNYWQLLWSFIWNISATVFASSSWFASMCSFYLYSLDVWNLSGVTNHRNGPQLTATGPQQTICKEIKLNCGLLLPCSDPLWSIVIGCGPL